jgi:hypothetical protein
MAFCASPEATQSKYSTLKYPLKKKRRYPSTKLHGAIPHKIVISILTAVRNQNFNRVAISTSCDA